MVTPVVPHPDHLHYSIHIRGRVQGVWFRSSAAKKARELNLKGFIRHNHYDSLQIEVEGQKEDLEAFIDWCKEGPPLAKVEDLTVEPGALQGYKGFVIQ